MWKCIFERETLINFDKIHIAIYELAGLMIINVSVVNYIFCYFKLAINFTHTHICVCVIYRYHVCVVIMIHARLQAWYFVIAHIKLKWAYFKCVELKVWNSLDHVTKNTDFLYHKPSAFSASRQCVDITKRTTISCKCLLIFKLINCREVENDCLSKF